MSNMPHGTGREDCSEMTSDTPPTRLRVVPVDPQDASSPPASAGDDLAASDSERIQAAGDRYLEIIAPVNEVVAMFNAATDDSFKAQTIQALSEALSYVTTEIERVDWPAAAEDAVRRLAAATDAASAAARLLVSELTDEAAREFAAEVLTLTTASSKMRFALGLPSQPRPS